MQFRELTDDRQWDLIRSSLPHPAYTGRPRADDNRMMTVNGILYVLMSGCCRWMDIMPSKYGSYKTTVWERHKKKWSEKEGVWKRVMDSLVSYGYHKGLINVNDLSIDSSTVAAVRKGRGKR